MGWGWENWRELGEIKEINVGGWEKWWGAGRDQRNGGRDLRKMGETGRKRGNWEKREELGETGDLRKKCI